MSPAPTPPADTRAAADHDLAGMVDHLRQREQNLLHLMDLLPGMVYRCRVDPDYNYALDFVSQRSRELLGLEPGDLVRNQQNTIERMMNTEDRARVREEMHQALVAGRQYQIVYRITLASGDCKWIWDQGDAMSTGSHPTGAPRHIGGMLVDISAHKTREIELLEENERLRSSMQESTGMGNLVGRSEAMRKVFRLVHKAAASDTGVIIYGETGTGKDVVARTIHEMSGRRGRFVAVNCGAIPEQLLESEFFGYKKGAFSGANRDHQGYLAAADGGSLFLDEIGELNLALQVKLLRVLENHQFTPVGSNVPQHSDFRLLAATNRDLKELVREKRMRADFYYRIHVLPIPIPPLRERREDINLLIQEFLARHAGNDAEVPALPPSLMQTMNRHDWPGNVRELQHFIERYLTFGDTSFSDLHSGPARPALVAPSPEETSGDGMKDTLQRVERTMILQALERTRWRRGEAARLLGFSVRTLQRRMKQLGL